jgi:hypothetical protein
MDGLSGRLGAPQSSRRGSRSIEHIGSAHDEAEVEALKAAARQKIAAGQLELELDLGLAAAGAGGPLPVSASRTGHLLDALDRGCRVLGLDEAAGGDEVFRLLALARVIEPASKLDSLRVLDEAGIAAPSYATVKRRLPAYAKDEWRQRLSEACAAHARLGPASLVLYDVSTLYFETDQGDGFREPGYSKERRLEPQITIGLLTDRAGFPLMLSALGRQGRDQDHAPGHQAVHESAPAARRHRGRRRGHDLRRQHEGDRGREPVVHLGHEDPRRPLPGGCSTSETHPSGLTWWFTPQPGTG